MKVCGSTTGRERGFENIFLSIETYPANSYHKSENMYFNNCITSSWSTTTNSKNKLRYHRHMLHVTVQFDRERVASAAYLGVHSLIELIPCSRAWNFVVLAPQNFRVLMCGMFRKFTTWLFSQREGNGTLVTRFIFVRPLLQCMGSMSEWAEKGLRVMRQFQFYRSVSPY